MKEIILRKKPKEREEYIFHCDYLDLKDLSHIQKSKGVIFRKCGSTSHVLVLMKIQSIPFYKVSDISLYKDGDYVQIKGDVLIHKEKEILNKNTKISSQALQHFKHLQVSVFDASDVNTINNKYNHVRQFFIRNEFIWIKKGISPAAYYTKEGEEKTISLMKKELKAILKETRPDQLINFRSFDMRSNEMIIFNQSITPETNPDMGLHGIRKTLKDQTEILISELKTVDKLYDEGHTNIIFSIPFITTNEEYIQIQELMKKYCTHDIKLGLFIENPSAVSEMNTFITQGIRYFYVGMKDLVQFLMAADRSNDAVNYLYTARSKVVSETLSKILRLTKEKNIETYVFSSPEDMDYFARFDDLEGISLYAGSI